MAEVGSAFVSILPSARGFGPALQRQVGSQVDAAGRKTGSRFGSAIKGALGLGGIGAAVGIGSFVKDSIQLEAEFGKTMRQIGIATGVPEKRLDRLDALAIKLGKDTVFSASDASQAMLELAKNGISAATIEAGALDSALTLAAAGGVDMTTAATTMGNALNAFNLKGKDSKQVAAALAGAANSSSASIGSIAEGLQQVSAVAADSGFTLQETTGALAAFATAGISGSDAGTTLKTMFARLLPQTAKAKGVMRQYGLMTYDAGKATEALADVGLKAASTRYEDVYKAVEEYLVRQKVATKGTTKLADATEKFLEVSGVMRNDFVKANGDFKDLTDISGELNDAFGKLSESERAAALNTLFGSDARRAASILVKEGEKGLRGYIKATEDQTQADKLAKANMEGTAGAIERLKGAWETTKLEFGKSIAPVAADFMETLAGNVDDVGPKLVSLGGFIKDDVVPPLKKAAGFAESMIDAFQSMPSWAKKVVIGGAVGGFAVKKLLPGVVGGAIKLGYSRAVPLPVFVVNNVGGGAGGFPGGKKGLAGVGVMTVGSVAIAAAAGFTIGKLFADKYLVSTPRERKINNAKLDTYAKGIPGVKPVANVFTGEMPEVPAVRKGIITDYKAVRGILIGTASAAQEARDKAIGLQTTLDKTPRQVDRITRSYEHLEAVLERLAEVSAGGLPNTPSEATPRGFGSDVPIFGDGANVNIRLNDEADLNRWGREQKRKRARAGH